MENIPVWVMIAGVLLAALAIYMIAWRIVEGTHVVVRATTRILLGALLVVPVILFLLPSQNATMHERMAPPAPNGGSHAEDVAKPRKKKAAAPPAEREDKATVADRAAMEAEAEEADARRLAEEIERTRRQVEKAARERAGSTTSASPPNPKEAAEIAAIEPGAGAEEAPKITEEGAKAAGGERKRVTRRHYRRSYGYRPPSSGSEGGGGRTGGAIGGLESAGNGGADVTLDGLTGGEPPEPPTIVAPDTGGISLDSVTNMGAPDIRIDEPIVEVPSPALPSESLPEEMVVMPDVSAPDIVPGAGAPATSTAAEEEKEDWSVVPVYYGTDRARADKEKRIAYDWKRGRRLELGRALVTIPKEHEVPMVERPWAIKIPYVDIVLYEVAEDPKKHFTMEELKALTKEEFLQLVKERLQTSARFKDHALVFIHGYKTKFDNAVYRTAQIAYDLKFDGAPFLYSWPSGGTLQGYTYDRESAGQAEIYLRQFLEMVRDEAGAKKVSIIAHSMGNQLLLRTLQDMKRSMPDGVQISQLILAAPDVDRDNFQNIVRSLEGIAEGITLYAAANDTALSFSRRVNGGEPRAGDVPDGGPIVMKGIDTIDATATSMDSVGINHSGYAENNALLEDIGKLVSAGIRPPGVRLPKLERIETDKGAYWRYPAP